MLKSAHLKNFRACKDVRLEDLGPMLGLVGRNGAGKTTLLQAIAWAATAAVASEKFSLLMASGDSGVGPAEPSGEFLFVAGTHEYHYKLSRTIRRQLTGRRTLHARDEENLRTRSSGASEWRELFARIDDSVSFADGRPRVAINTSTAATPALMSLLPGDDPLQVHLRAVADLLRRVRYYPGHNVFDPIDSLPEEPSEPVSEDDYQRWVAADEPGLARTSVLMRLIAAAQQRPELFAELKQQLGPAGLGLLQDIRIEDFGPPPVPPGSRRHHYFRVAFKPINSDVDVELSLGQLSGGTRHVLYLLLGLLYDESSTMLIEQPEDGIHPALLAKLIDILRVNADPTQIVLASHSPTVLSSLSPSDVRLVAMQDGAIQVRSLTAAEVQRAQNYIQREGSLAEFLELIQED